MTKKTFMSPTAASPVTPTTEKCNDMSYGSTSRSGTTVANNSPTGNRSAGPGRGFVNPSSYGSTGSTTLPSTGAGAGRGFTNPDFVKADNMYAHESNNVVTTPVDDKTLAGTSFDDLSLRTKFLPNVLDNFDVVTYKWKLYITDPDSSSKGNVLDPTNNIVIAESGVTDLTIDNVVINSVATPTNQTGTGVSTEVKFDITEPGGAGMIDKIFYQSVALGIGNWAVMPLYLELQFKGRDPESSSPLDGSPGSLSALKWLWVLKISDIKAHVTHAGTKYEFSTIVYNDFAQSNLNFSLKQNVVLENISTFEDAMEKLQNKLNEEQFRTLITFSSIADTYRIIVDPKIAKYLITPNNKNENSHRSWNYGKFENKDANFNTSTGIDKIVDCLLSQTEEYQKFLTGSPTAGSQSQTMSQESSQMKKFWRVITETRPTKFDPRRNDMAKEFVIFVVQYDLGVLDYDVFQSSAPPITAAATKKRLMTYLKKSILRKKYDYIFTGLNDQILSFDLKINCAWANSMARYGGIYSNYDNNTVGIVTQNNALDEQAISDAINKAISLQNSSKSPNDGKAEKAIQEARVAIETAKINEVDRNRYRVLLEQSKPENRVNFVNKTVANDGIGADGEFNRVKNEAIFLSKPVTEKITQKQLRFISDVDITSSNAIDAYTSYMKNSRGKLRPVARTESIQDMQVGQGIEANNNSGLQRLSTMFSVALHSGLDASFANIKLIIKGDPFWLWPQPISNTQEFRLYKSQMEDKVKAIELVKNGYYKENEYVNYNSSDNFILIRFRTPKIYNNTDVNQNSTDTTTDIQTFSGVYKITFITNKFENGKFTQELECIIDPEIMYLDIADVIENISKDKNIKTNPQDLESPVTIPETSIKTNRIANTE